ncbi:MAG: ATP-binding cassette domain-containing protein [Helicobacter sp.]|nr:ATP-binding cassette domain-containing protein [Helicobacter sp.]
MSTLLEVKNLSVYHSLKKESLFKKAPRMRAVNSISFELKRGQVLGVVGESGCGKSTLARALLGLNPQIEGEIIYEGQDLAKDFRVHKSPLLLRKEIQMIFQDPLASLNPRQNIGSILEEPLRIHFPNLSKKQKRDRILETIKKVGLLESQINRYPHELSGGQAQRVGIARALIIQPKLIICDEPVSALDVSIQSQIVNLLKDIQKEENQSLIFIAHDLSIVKYMSDNVLVMYLGNAVEVANTDSIYDAPAHPYTKALFDAVPIPDPMIQKNRAINLLEGDLPSPINPPKGCAFHTRCPKAKQSCQDNAPSLVNLTDSHKFACFYPN